MTKIFNVWKITTYQEYLEEWPAIPGKFDKLTDYQKSLGYQTPEEFFNKQAYAAQQLANNRVGNILDRVFEVEDLTDAVQIQLKKFTYQAIDYLRMNDLVIAEDVRTNQTNFNNNRTDTSQVNIDRIEQYVGTMAWRSWILANIQDLYISWAKDNKIPYLLDPEHFYNKTEIDIKLADLDDMIQVQQKMVDEKLVEFNQKMEERLTKFTETLPNDKDFIDKITDKINDGTVVVEEVKKKLKADSEFKQALTDDIAENKKFSDKIASDIAENNEFLDKTNTNLVNNPDFIDKTSDKVIVKDGFIDKAGTNIADNDPFITKVADRLSDTVVTKQYVDNQDKKTLEDAKNYVNQFNCFKWNNEVAAFNIPPNSPGGEHVSMSSKKIMALADGTSNYEAVNYQQLQTKQDKLTAGSYINIKDKVISSVPWIVGEYKYMPVNQISMPPGWVKIQNTGVNEVLAFGVGFGAPYDFFVEAKSDRPSNFVEVIAKNDKSFHVGGMVNGSLGAFEMTFHETTLWQFNPTKYAEQNAKSSNLNLSKQDNRN